MSEVIIKPTKNFVDITMVRNHFPLLQEKIHDQTLIYLDNAATTQKPFHVLDAMTNYYEHTNANIHRGVHTLSVRATDQFEQARQLVQQFIHAQYPHEIIFTHGTTESINLIAHSFVQSQLQADDEIILSMMEHHSNIVPWQLNGDKVGARIKVIPINDNGELDVDAFRKLLNKKTKMVALTHVSNAIGTINPISEIIQIAHEHDIPVLIDGAQAVPHQRVNVQQLDCDFYVFSGHKMYGPTGIGVLYGKTKWLEKLPPYQGGGDMISEVSFEKTRYNKLPHKFEAGTPNIAGAIGLGAAIRYLNSIGMDAIENYEKMLLSYATKLLNEIDDLQIIGSAKEKAAVISFVLDNIHPHDIGTVLDHEGIAIRAGHHCAMPLMTRYNIPATARISLGIYNTVQEIDALVAALSRLQRLFE